MNWLKISAQVRCAVIALTPILIVSCFLTVLGFWSDKHMILDWAAQFRVQYVVIQSGFVLIYFFSRSYRRAWIVALFVIMNLTVIAPLFVGRDLSRINKTSLSLRLVLVNLNVFNRHHDRVRALIKEQNPDVLVFEEINQFWQTALEGMLNDYPYRRIVARDDAFGIAVFSRQPLSDIQEEHWGHHQVPSIRSTLDVLGVPITLIATHPLPPGGQEYWCSRNAQLQELASQRPHWAERVIIAGDLNTVPWTKNFQDLLKRANLVNSQQGFGWQVTWPTACPLLWIPLDHVLISPNLYVINRMIGKSMGSDHYPLIVDIGI